MDFTLDKYAQIVRAALAAGYKIFPVSDWADMPESTRQGVMMRHDVDRHPENALAMAKLEHELCVRSTYYFRILPCAFDPEIITAIAMLGHEIGYHYEDWHLAKRDPAKAMDMFKTHLARLRALVPIRSIAMHGSPLSRENNMTIWKHFSYADYAVNDAILSFDYSGYIFFTDSGRTFGPSTANLRDYLGNADTVPEVRTSDDLAAWLAKRPAERIQINVHPERWNTPGPAWLRQWAVDQAANTAKRGLKLLRGKPK